MRMVVLCFDAAKIWFLEEKRMSFCLDLVFLLEGVFESPLPP